MGEPVEPTDDELESLQFGGVPSGDMPDPEPEVIARAQQIVDQAIEQGDQGSRVWEGTGGEEPVTVVRDTTVSDDDKLRFMAHILGDRPYEKTYSLLGGKLRLHFASIQQSLNAILVRMAREHGVSYFEALLLASLKWVEEDGVKVEIDLLKQTLSTEENVFLLETWLSGGITRAQYHLIRDAFAKFDAELDLLIEKADDPDFWPTPS